MPIGLILIIIAIILTIIINKNRHLINIGNHPYKCKVLRRQLLTVVHRDTAERLIRAAKYKHPEKSQGWNLEKVIYDLQRRR